MKKVQINPLPLILPIPAVLVGTYVAGKPNYSAIGNCGIVCFGPPVIYVSSLNHHYTNRGVRASQAFSVNLPSVDLAEKVDYCGIVSGHRVDKSNLFATFPGVAGETPLIVDCPVNLECKVI